MSQRTHVQHTKPGYAYLHPAEDDHSRLVYSEILTDERKETTAGFWTRANDYFKEWAYARVYSSEAERMAQYDTFIHNSDHHRGHTALGGAAPVDRVPNLRA